MRPIIKKMNMDIKNLLYGWCGAHKFPFPVYQNRFVPPRKNQDGTKTQLHFESQVSLTIFFKVFKTVGFGSNKRQAQTEAAKNICELLKAAGYDVTEQTLPKNIKKSTLNDVVTSSDNKKRKHSEQSGPENSKRSKPELIELDSEPKILDTEQCHIINVKNESSENDVEILNYVKPSPELVNLNDSGSMEGPSRDLKPPSRDIEVLSPDPGFDLPLFDINQLPKDKLEKLNQDLWSHYFNVKQTNHVFSMKYTLMQTLNNHLQRYFNPDSYLYLFGSSITGLGSFNADLDLCFVVPPSNLDEARMDQRRFALCILRRLRSVLYGYYSRNVGGCDAINLVPAKVPILKLTNVRFNDLVVDVDINVNNTAGVRNSHLLHYYNMIDERFAALVLAVKHWAINADISAPVNGTLSGLCFSLMVLHFLQKSGPNRPPLLPNLHEILPHSFNERTKIADLKIFDQSLLPLNIRPSPNKQSLAELFVEFFDYYANRVDFVKEVISVRTNGVLKPRLTLPQSVVGRNDCFIYVEEPYDFTNCARCVFEFGNFFKIKEAFSDAIDNLRNHVTLSSIGVNL